MSHVLTTDYFPFSYQRCLFILQPTVVLLPNWLRKSYLPVELFPTLLICFY